MFIDNDLIQVVHDGLFVTEVYECLDFHIGEEGKMLSYRVFFMPAYSPNGENNDYFYADSREEFIKLCKAFNFPDPSNDACEPRFIDFTTLCQVDPDTNKVLSYNSPKSGIHPELVFEQIVRGIKLHHASLGGSYYFLADHPKLDRRYARFSRQLSLQAEHGVDCIRAWYNDLNGGRGYYGIYAFTVREEPQPDHSG